MYFDCSLVLFEQKKNKHLSPAFLTKTNRFILRDNINAAKFQQKGTGFNMNWKIDNYFINYDFHSIETAQVNLNESRKIKTQFLITQTLTWSSELEKYLHLNKLLLGVELILKSGFFSLCFLHSAKIHQNKTAHKFIIQNF